jgi:hypothetical protein
MLIEDQEKNWAALDKVLLGGEPQPYIYNGNGGAYSPH